jgi:predicted RNA-binding Zn-ribbon protein involved in translation (DUF1610 family)
MARNLFDLVPALAFDPPEKKKNAELKINKCLEEKKKYQATESDPNAREKLIRDIHDLEECLKSIDTRLEKDAAEWKKQVVASLESTIDMTKNRENREITTGKINKYRKERHLDKETIEKIFKDKGFTIVETNKGKLPLLLSELTMKQIKNDINTLMMDTGGGEDDQANRKKIENVFWFAAYIDGDISNGNMYKSKSAEELREILSKKEKEYTTRNDNLGHALQSLCSIGRTKIFDSDEHIKSYKNSLRYAKLEETFNLIKNLLESDRRSEEYAEAAIAKIQKEFPDYNESLAIYNKEADLQDDPYEPEQVKLSLSCGSCGVLLTFNSLREAQKATCPHCGQTLYKPCPKCGEMVPLSADYCPRENCGFFIAGIKNFNRYYDEALAALERYDINEAQNNLSRAKSSNPGDPRLKILEQKIKQAASEYEKPLKEIQSFIDQKKLLTAGSKITELRIKQPKLNLSSFESQVKPKLEEADKLFALTVSKSPAEKIKICIKILNFCTDYAEALFCMQAMPPAPCPVLTVKPDPNEGVCAVSWQPSPDELVKYVLVRKTGGIPANTSDGTKILDEEVHLDYQDKDIEPGRSYGYAVFTKRFGAISKGTGKIGTLYSEISALRCDPGENFCSLAWELPKNCTGVRISRKNDGIPAYGEAAKVIAENAQRSFKDTDLIPGRRYGYRLQALYHGDSDVFRSMGITCSVLPERKPHGVKIFLALDGSNHRFSWDPIQEGFDLRLVKLNDGVSVEEGRVYKDSDMRAVGKVITTERSDKGSAFFFIKEETCFEAACFIIYSDKGIASNTVLINTYKPCELNGKPKLHDTDICLFLKTPLPKYLKSIYYTVRKKHTENAPPPWAGPEDVREMNSISTEEYLNKGEIVIPGITEAGDYYITLLAGYDDGTRMVYANPVKKRFSNTVPGKINFGVKYSKIFKKAELIVEFEASQSISQLPSLSLCYSETGALINSANDKNSRVLLVTAEEQCYPGKRKTKSFQLNINDVERMPRGRYFNLFTTDESITDDYRIGFIERFTGTL